MGKPAPLALAWLALLLAACSSPDDAGRVRPTLSGIQKDVFDLTCAKAKCHADNTGESQLSLARGRARASLVNIRSVQMRELLRVAPGRPEESYLLRKVRGDRIVGERMPQGLEPLREDQIAAIRDWIARGAPDD